MPRPGSTATECCKWRQEAGTGSHLVANDASGLRAMRAVHVGAVLLGELAVGLLDHDPAIQRGLELLGDSLAVAYVALMQQPMVATSASAWPMRRSAGSNGPGKERVTRGEVAEGFGLR